MDHNKPIAPSRDEMFKLMKENNGPFMGMSVSTYSAIVPPILSIEDIKALWKKMPKREGLIMIPGGRGFEVYKFKESTIQKAIQYCCFVEKFEIEDEE